MSNRLLDDIFQVNAVDKQGKKFDRVSRIEATSASLNLSLTLDVNFDLFPLLVGDKITLMLASDLFDASANGAEQVGPDGERAPAPDRREAWRGGEQGLAEEYDYVTYGKVYKFEDVSGPQRDATAYISYGGLLMALRGSYNHFNKLHIGDNVYCLIRK